MSRGRSDPPECIDLCLCFCSLGRTNLRDIKVRLGEYDFSSPDETRSLDFSVLEIRVHRDFDYISYENDIAMVKMRRPTVFNSYIWPVCLPPVDQTFENRDAVVTG